MIKRWIFVGFVAFSVAACQDPNAAPEQVTQSVGTVEKLGREAFEAWIKGEKTGDYGRFTALLSPSFQYFSHPSKGRFEGESALSQLRAVISDKSRKERSLRINNVNITSNNSTMFCQFDAYGKLGTQTDYWGTNAVAFTFINGKLTGVQEYIGNFEQLARR